jgi:hypothetical protein
VCAALSSRVGAENRHPMTDDHDDQRNSFHWPPTSEEMDSIQVIEVHDDAADAQRARASDGRASGGRASVARSWWHRMIEEAIVAQVGLAAASFAAIGIAVTSLLAPAQPAARTAKREATSAPIVAPSTAPSATGTAPAQTLPEASTFQHRVTFDAPPPALEQVRAEREARPRAALSGAERGELTPREELAAAREERAAAREEERTTASGRDAAHGARASAARESLASASTSRRGARGSAAPQGNTSLTNEKPRAGTRAGQTTLVARHAGSRATPARPDAGTDPVSRVAKQAGTSVWKAMRAVGRSFSHAGDDDWAPRPATRSAASRRTAAAVDLAADDAPSAR